MAWYGAKPGVLGQPWNVQAVYWGVFLLSMLVTFYMVLLDFRYIRMQYRLGEKELFEDTLGSEEFRKALRGTRPAGSGGPTHRQADSSPGQTNPD